MLPLPGTSRLTCVLESLSSQRCLLVLAALAAVAEAFVATPMRPAALRASVAPAVAAPSMVLEPTSVDAATTLLAIGLPIPAFTPAKAFISACRVIEPLIAPRPGHLCTEANAHADNGGAGRTEFNGSHRSLGPRASQ